MKIEIVRPRSYDDSREAVARFYEAVAAGISGLPEFSDRPDLTIRVVLGGAEECRFWNVTQQALGFHAIAARNIDDDGMEWFEVNEFHEVHLNLDIVREMLSDRWDGMTREDRLIDMESHAMTLPHELFHAIDWIKATDGRTPLEVFDQGEGEISLMKMQREIDRDDSGNGISTEDRIEAVIQRMIWAISPTVIAPAFDDFERSLQEHSRPPGP